MDTPQHDENMTYWQKHRYMLLVASVILISMTLASISVIIYNVTGANQLDLSRPGYQAVSSQVDETDNIDEYSAFGPFSVDAGNEFLDLYDEQATKAKAVDAFNGDPLNPELLEFGDVTATE